MNVSKACLIGERHRRQGKECEDFVGGGKCAGVCYAILADGAGSRKYGYETAKWLNQATKTFVQEIAEDSIFPPKDEDVINYMNKALREYDLPLEEMGATFLLVIVKDNIFYLAHVGDGIIIAKTDDKFKILSYPENGEFLNETYFFPSEEPNIHFRSLTGKLSKSFCFILVSDGISETLYDSQSKEISPACGTIYNWCQKYSEKVCDEILKQNLIEVFDSFGDDDKSIVVLSE